jgi:hypothetical protein
LNYGNNALRYLYKSTAHGLTDFLKTFAIMSLSGAMAERALFGGAICRPDPADLHDIRHTATHSLSPNLRNPRYTSLNRIINLLSSRLKAGSP